MTNGDRGGAAPAGDVLSSLFDGPLGKGLAPAARAARAWYAANGDRERRHTTGVWLRSAGRTGADPVLVVALDSNLLASELGTNKDLYLARLAFHGLSVSDIRFTVGKKSLPTDGRGASSSRTQTARSELAGRKDPRALRNELPQLSEEEKESVAEATQDFPDGLRQSVSRAMCASLRRSKTEHTRNV